MSGRPSKYSETLADEICQRVAGGRSLKSVCLDDDMPSMASVFKWIGEKDGFSEKYRVAMEARSDVVFEEILEIADEHNMDDVNRARLRVDARKWVAARLAPKKYGDKIQAEHTGADGGPLTVQVLRFTGEE